MGKNSLSFKEFRDAIGNALNMPMENVRRIVIDAKDDDWVRIYVEQVGTRKLLDINLETLMKNQSIEPESGK